MRVDYTMRGCMRIHYTMLYTMGAPVPVKKEEFMSKRKSVRFDVLREYKGDTDMEKVFERRNRERYRKKYDLWLEKKRVETRREAC